MTYLGGGFVSEDFQVVRYDAEGKYRPHHDYTAYGEHASYAKKIQKTGNRIVTLLAFLANPASGGHTAFPIAGLTVQPSAGDALLFHNLHEGGHGDLLSMHGGCGVSKGGKWIVNKWFRTSGLERAP